MLQKLPDWVTSRWNRHVTKQLRQTEEYPKFKEFAEFLTTEAEIACNPVTSFHALKPTDEKPSRDIKRTKANAFITNVKASDKSGTELECNAVESSLKVLNRAKKLSTSFTSSPVTCMCCGDSHSIQVHT